MRCENRNKLPPYHTALLIDMSVQNVQVCLLLQKILYICTGNSVQKKDVNLPVSNLKDKNNKENQWANSSFHYHEHISTFSYRLGIGKTDKQFSLYCGLFGFYSSKANESTKTISSPWAQVCLSRWLEI